MKPCHAPKTRKFGSETDVFRAFLIGLGSVLLLNTIRRFLTTTLRGSDETSTDHSPTIDPDSVRDADFRDLHP